MKEGHQSLPVKLWYFIRALWSRPAIRRSIQAAWLVFILVFIALALSGSWKEISEIKWTGRLFAFISLAFVFALIRRLSGGWLWVAIVKLMAGKKAISTIQGLRIYFLSNLATYIPGSYWNVPSLIYMQKQQGISASKTGGAILLQHYLVILSGALLGLFGLDLLAARIDLPVAALPVIVSAVILGMAALHPRLLGFFTRIMARILKKDPPVITVTYPQLIGLLAISIIVWLLGAASLLFQAHAFVPEVEISVQALFRFGAIFAVSWLAGFFTPFAPNGLGVREGVIGLALGLMGVSMEFGLLIAASSRLLIVLEDIAWGGVAFVVKPAVLKNDSRQSANDIIKAHRG